MNNTYSSFLSIEELSVCYQKQIILSNCSLTLKKGEILSLLGPSGCGKSTLLKAITGLIPITEGCISLSDQILSTKDCQIPPAQRGIGMIFQDYALFPHLTVKENILFGLKKQKKAKIDSRLDKTLALFHLDPLQNRYPHQLSGGQQQRVAIARSLICEPNVLLFDEPFSNLDTQIRNDLMQEIKQLLRKQNMTAIFVTHNKVEAFALADKVAIMKEGKIVQFDSPQALYDNPINSDVADFLGSGVGIIATKTDKGWQTDLGLIPFHSISTGNVWSNQQLNKQQNIIYLRPHQITLKTAQSDKNSYPITELSFQGDFQEYTITLPSQNIKVLSTERFYIGEKITISLSIH